MQNIAVRKYLERRSNEKEQDEKEKKEREKALENSQQEQYMQQQLAAQRARDEASASTKKKKKGFWGRGKKDDDEEEEVNEADLYHSPRPAFFAHTRPTRRTQVPRDVAVPYFRFRKDRFYDWPPDPTVSRATPLMAGSTKDDDLGYNDDDLDESQHPNRQSDFGGGGDGGPRRRRGGR